MQKITYDCGCVLQVGVRKAICKAAIEFIGGLGLSVRLCKEHENVLRIQKFKQKETTRLRKRALLLSHADVPSLAPTLETMENQSLSQKENC
jgi:hypothetical protein